MIGVIKMFSEYLKHRFSAFKRSLIGSFLYILLSYFMLRILVSSGFLFTTISFVYNFLVIGLLLFLILSSTVFCVGFLYIIFGDGVRQDFYGEVEIDFMNLFNLYVSIVFPKEFNESIKFLEKDL